MRAKVPLIFALILALTTAAQAADVQHVVLVSIDGLSATYLDDPNASLPTLREIRQAGSSANAMITTFPSVTWPAHVSLVTGVRPGTHGFLANQVHDRRTGQPVLYTNEPASTEAEAIQAPTLYDALRAGGGRTSAALLWPATIGSRSLDWIVPDVATARERGRHMTPGLDAEMLAAGIQAAELDTSGWRVADPADRDATTAKIACFLLKNKQPNLLLLHLNAPDSVQHSTGPNVAAAYQAVAAADRALQSIWQTLRASALAKSSALFVVSDHGLAPYNQLIEPNVILKELGLIGTNIFGSINKRNAWSMTLGGAAYVYLFDDSAISRQAEIVAALKGMEGVERVIEPAEFARLGLPDPDKNFQMAQLILIARPGYCFDERSSGSATRDAGGRKGTHGYPPERGEMQATFVAAGAGIRQGARLKTVDILDVAPTIAQLLRVQMPTLEGHAIDAILER